MEPQVIRESRVKMGGYLAISLAFVALFVWMALGSTSERDVLTGWIGVALFGVGALLFGWLLVRPQVLRLDAQGFVLEGGLVRTPKRIAWADIDRFFVVNAPRGGELILFSYLPGRAPPSRLGRLIHPYGADGGLPKNWTLSPKALVALLNDYRAKCAPAGTPAAEPQQQLVS